MFYLSIFLGGILSFFSPCILPVLPLYIGYLTGSKLEDRKTLILNTIFFVVGISFAFVILSFGFSTLGMLLFNWKNSFIRVAGIIIFLLGFFQLGIIKSNFLQKERKIEIIREKISPIGAFLLGFTFSFAWTPCVGPALSGILLMSSSLENRVQGYILMGIYTLGFILPFILTGFFSSQILKVFKRNMAVVKYTQKILGIFLIVLGILVYFDKINNLLFYFI